MGGPSYKAPRCVLALSLLLLLTGCGGNNADPVSVAAPRLLAQSSVVNGIAAFPGRRNNYTISKSSAGTTVTDLVGNAGASVLMNVRSIEFADATVNLVIGDTSRRIDSADLQSLVELYLAFFGRLPDADGLDYWIGKRADGMSLAQISDSFYQVAITSDFTALTGYAAGMDDRTFVTKIYENVLGRSPDAGGLNFWSALLSQKSRGEVVLSMLLSAHAFKGHPDFGFVADLMDNKYAVASYFALQQGLNFLTRDDAFTKGQEVMRAVTPTATAAALLQITTGDKAFNLLFVAPTFASVQAIITQRCLPCHASRPTQPGFTAPPAGIMFNSADQIRQLAQLIYGKSVLSQFMPLGNATKMTDEERATVGAWFVAGAL